MSLLHRLFARTTPGNNDDMSRREAVHIGRRAPNLTAPGNGSRDREQILADAAAMSARGHFGAALALVQTTIVERPNDPEFVYAQAATLFSWGRLREAHAAAIRAEALGFRHVSIDLLLGRCCYWKGSLDEAEAWMRKALAVDPEGWESHLALAVVLEAKERPADAAAAYERALVLKPKDFDCLIGLGNCRLQLGDRVGAEERFRRAIAVNAQSPVAWQLLGVALERQERDREAGVAFARSMELERSGVEEVDSFYHLAVSLRDAGHAGEAQELLAANLAHRPNVHALLAYSHLLLAAGRLREGWSLGEFRWLQHPLLELRQKLDRPVWAGQDLSGKSILLHWEQGIGDMIQFLRYANYVKARGATVLVWTATAALKNLARGFPGVDIVLGPDERSPDFDYYIYLLSLPRVFGTDINTIPAEVPYLQVEPERVARLAPFLGQPGPRRIGLVWAGNPRHPNDRYRSIPLESLAPLAHLDGVRYFSLQKGVESEALKSFAPGCELVDLGPELDDFCDTAALVSQLDLVICVDTAVAHLAGALGKPVWLLVAQPADWRWLEEREDSPWYPTMRLFRQRRRGDWGEVVERVATALARWVGGDAAELMPCADRPATASCALIPAPGQWPPPGHRPGFTAVAETRLGALQYLPDEADVGVAIGWYGELLQAQLNLLTQFLRPGMTVLEVGAGIGVHAQALAAAVGPTGHLMLFESRPLVRRILQQNIAAHRIDNITVMRCGLGHAADCGREIPFAEASSRQNVASSSTGAGTCVGSLDELLLERLDWLKINDSISALDVLDGGAATLWRLRPGLLVSVSDRTAFGGVADRLQEFGYRCWRVETPCFNPENFNRRDHDMFSGATALALLAIPEEVQLNVAPEGCVELSYSLHKQ
jgi:FkbM family methyltransferase